ncbi:MICOS complex subunit MIC27 isoform X1 [Onychomys torridus]|uniref:MICOS complex subunit MIC27 isoform X1 n=1 Tax=Onychomys torridus TaxID=38674 RepID=UPI00167FD1CC|nr:MICOS complex subunit MIC27 isoform X1 [Onychomys torridus]
MAAFRMRKLTTMPAGLMYASINVHLAKEEEPKKQLVRPEQLPIYTAPPLHSKYVEEQPGYLQMGFASIRTTTVRYIGWCKGVYIFMKNGIMDTVQFGKDAYVYLKNPPQDFLPKMGVITASGLMGLVSARKGSRFKKIAYPLGLASLGATVCYPAQSVIIAKITGKKAYTTSQQIFQAIKSLWTKSSEKESLPEPQEETKVGKSGEIHAKTPDLKHSVTFPKDLASATAMKSESTADSICIMLLLSSYLMLKAEHSFYLTPSLWITDSLIQKIKICTALEVEMDCSGSLRREPQMYQVTDDG